MPDLTYEKSLEPVEGFKISNEHKEWLKAYKKAQKDEGIKKMLMEGLQYQAATGISRAREALEKASERKQRLFEMRPRDTTTRVEGQEVRR